MPTPARFCPRPGPGQLAAAAGLLGRADLLLRHGGGAGQPPDLAALLVGHQQQRRGHRALLLRLAQLLDHRGDLVSLEMFSPKKITPAAWPGADVLSRAAGGVSPE